MDKSSIWSVMFWILQGLIQESIADCSAAELSISDVVSPRGGIHYVVIPDSDYVIPSSSSPSSSPSSSSTSSSSLSSASSSSSPQSKCPSGSSLTYIKSQEEWEDWKYIRGKYVQLFEIII